MQQRPALLPHLTVAWEAFHMLTHSRSIGMGGISGILLSEIRSHIEWLGVIDRDDQEELMQQILTLDHAYLSYCQDEQEKRSKK